MPGSPVQDTTEHVAASCQVPGLLWLSCIWTSEISSHVASGKNLKGRRCFNLVAAVLARSENKKNQQLPACSGSLATSLLVSVNPALKHENLQAIHEL